MPAPGRSPTCLTSVRASGTTSSTSIRRRAPWLRVRRRIARATDRLSMHGRTLLWLLGAGLWAGAVFAAEPQGLPGENPHPIHLVRRPVAPFSAMALLGRQIFYDPSLS